MIIGGGGTCAAPGITFTRCHGVVRTGFGKNDRGPWRIGTTLASPFLRSPGRGARSLVWLALAPETAGLTAVYVEDERVVEPSAQAHDDALTSGLRERSAALVGV